MIACPDYTLRRHNPRAVSWGVYGVGHVLGSGKSLQQAAAWDCVWCIACAAAAMVTAACCGVGCVCAGVAGVTALSLDMGCVAAQHMLGSPQHTIA